MGLVEALIVAIIVIAVVFLIAGILTRYTPLPADMHWAVYLIAALVSVYVLWRVVAPVIGGL